MLTVPSSPLDLSPAPYNPRRLGPEAAAGLSRSLQEFGDIAGITWNARTRRLVTGHQRLARLLELHGDALRIDVLPGEGGERAQLVAPDGSTWAIRIVDWPEEREKAANNPFIGGNGPWGSINRHSSPRGARQEPTLSGGASRGACPGPRR